MGNYTFLTKQRGGSGRPGLNPPTEDSVWLRLLRTKADAESDQTSLMLFNAGLVLDVENEFTQGFHVMVGSDYADGKVAIFIRDDLEFEVKPPEQRTDKVGNLLYDKDGNPKMSGERVVYKGKDVWNARRASDNSNYHSISGGGDQLATVFGIPHGEQIWVRLSQEDENLFSGNLRDQIERIDSV